MNELWGVGRTFILAGLFVIATVILVVIGKIPEVITMADWQTYGAWILGIFAVKSVGHAVANRNSGGIK